MILPTKHLREDRALISVGGELLKLLDEPKTVSRVWEELKHSREDAVPDGPTASRSAQGPDSKGPQPSGIPFDWFILALDLLYALGAVKLERGRIRRVSP